MSDCLGVGDSQHVEFHWRRWKYSKIDHGNGYTYLFITKSLCILYFKCVNCIVNELYLDKTFFNVSRASVTCVSIPQILTYVYLLFQEELQAKRNIGIHNGWNFGKSYENNKLQIQEAQQTSGKVKMKKIIPRHVIENCWKPQLKRKC